MSELTPNQHELNTSSGQSAESFKPEQEQHAEEAPKVEETPTIDIEATRKEVLGLERTDAPLELPIDASPDGDQPMYIDRAMKKISLNNELKLIRAKLPSGQRLLSKGVHQPVIRRLSDTAAHTLTRPVGLLGGGILAFCGSLIYLLFSKYVGLKYNYLIFIMLFVFGYALATFLEFVLKAVHPPKED